MSPLPNSPLNFLKGAAMGVAEVIPGVSGGTIAFVTGIYERLLTVIKSILGPTVLRAWRQGGLRAAWAAADGAFLVTLLSGMAAGLVVGVFGISHLLEHYPPLIWAFFFGLILASAVYVGRHVREWGVAEAALLLAGALAAYTISVATPSQGLEEPWFVFVCGAIAISALMLPGVSGSFMLLLMGMYAYVLGAVKATLESLDPASMLVVVTFAAGCLVGMATFSRVLTWLFRRFHDQTMAALTGFMVGSLYKIWPWRNVISYRENSKGEQVPFQETSVWPAQYAEHTGQPEYLLGALALIVVGIVLVIALGRVTPKSE
jgi:putative membrane protein